MNNTRKIVLSIVALAVVIAGVAILRPSEYVGGLTHNQKESFMEGLFAGASRETEIDRDGDLRVGDNGTSIHTLQTGGCTIWAGSQTITATTTQQVECQSATNGSLASGLTGITSDSICHLTMASSTNTTLASIVVGGASASSTAGSIVARIVNLTGTTFTWDATASSSAKWKYTCYDPA